MARRLFSTAKSSNQGVTKSFHREILSCSYEVKYPVISSKNARLKSVSNPHFHTVFLYGLSSPTLPPQTPSFPFCDLPNRRCPALAPVIESLPPKQSMPFSQPKQSWPLKVFFSSLNWPFRPGAGVQGVQRANNPLCLF